MANGDKPPQGGGAVNVKITTYSGDANKVKDFHIPCKNGAEAEAITHRLTAAIEEIKKEYV